MRAEAYWIKAHRVWGKAESYWIKADGVLTRADVV